MTRIECDKCGVQLFNGPTTKDVAKLKIDAPRYMPIEKDLCERCVKALINFLQPKQPE